MASISKRGDKWHVRICRKDYAIQRAGLKKADGQLTHICRHTFASHFMMNGGSITTLRDILGHHSLAMTTKYAHFSPEHLEQAITLNPIYKLQVGCEQAVEETVTERIPV